MNLSFLHLLILIHPLIPLTHLQQLQKQNFFSSFILPALSNFLFCFSQLKYNPRSFGLWRD